MLSGESLVAISYVLFSYSKLSFQRLLHVFVSKQAKASAIIASENSTLHKRAILSKFTEYLTHVLNSFYQAVFSAPAKTDWERGYVRARCAKSAHNKFASRACAHLQYYKGVAVDPRGGMG